LANIIICIITKNNAGGILKALKFFCIVFISVVSLPIFVTAGINFTVEPTKALKVKDGEEVNYRHLAEVDKKWSLAYGVGYGIDLLDGRLKVGPNVGLSWHAEKDKVTKLTPDDLLNLPFPILGLDDITLLEIVSKERFVMLPASVFVIVDPLKSFVRPAFHAAFGWNSVFLYNFISAQGKPLPPGLKVGDFEEEIKKYDGYYGNVYTKFGVDLKLGIGKKFSVYAGPQWQFSTVELKTKKPYSEPNERKLNAFGFRLGIGL
jgi:hypothetical protein